MCALLLNLLGFSGGSGSKNPTAMRETWIRSLGYEDALEKGTAIYSSILVWRNPWAEDPGRLQSMKSQRVRHTTEQLTLHIAVKKILNLLLIGG